MSGQDLVTIAQQDLRSWVGRILAAAGASDEEARLIAHGLVDANLHGHDSHGVARVPRYLEAVSDGHVFFGRRAKLVVDEPSHALFEGNHAFGQVVMPELVAEGARRAKAGGVAMVGLRRCGHLGRIGLMADMACDEGVASVHFVNVRNSTLVSPFGGAQRRMSTAPFCVGLPVPGGRHYCLDFATSKVAEGKVMVAAQGGDPVPDDSMVDGHGGPTGDPAALYGQSVRDAVPNPRAGEGALVAFGGHKGSGLALACELLAGALTGSLPSAETGGAGQVWNGGLSFFFMPGALDDGFGHGRLVADYLDYVRSSRPLAGVGSVMAPGDPERACHDERSKHGVPLPRSVFEKIAHSGERLGVRGWDKDG